MARTTESDDTIEVTGPGVRRGNGLVPDSVAPTVEESTASGLDPLAGGDGASDRTSVIRESLDLVPRVTGRQHLQHSTTTDEES